MNAAVPRGAGRHIGARWRMLVARVRREITWGRIFRATTYVRSALWFAPIVAMLLILALGPLLRALDAWLDWRGFGLDLQGAQSLLQTVITLTLSFLVFTFGSLLVAIQVAGGQLTPRIIATTLLRDNVVRYSVGMFVFTLVFAVSALNRLGGHVPQVALLVIALLGIACVCGFLFFIDYAARLMRPVAMLARVGESGIAVIHAVYPELLDGRGDDEEPSPSLGEPGRVFAHLGRSEILRAIDLPTLVAAARRRDGLVEVVPEVGDFIATGEPLFMLHGGAADIPDHKLAGAVVLGSERTLEQDPMFALRIIADIGLKALSAAINDPTTAVLAIDQVHRLLRVVGRRQLRGEAVRDREGRTRVILRTPHWEDFVHVACVEIRECGAGNVQVARRLAAMLEDLGRLLPEHRRPALVLQQELLERALVRLYSNPEDLALARTPDVQGLGGSASRRRSNGP